MEKIYFKVRQTTYNLNVSNIDIAFNQRQDFFFFSDTFTI